LQKHFYKNRRSKIKPKLDNEDLMEDVLTDAAKSCKKNGLIPYKGIGDNRSKSMKAFNNLSSRPFDKHYGKINEILK